MGNWLKSSLGAVLSLTTVDFPFWVVKLDNSKLISERDWVKNEAGVPLPDWHKHLLTPQEAERWQGVKRPIDWSLDIVGSGDIRRVKELWLLCPPSRVSPTGNTARLPVVVPCGVFQFKVANVDSTIVAAERTQVAQVIGRIDDALTGDCTCFIWDREMGGLVANYQTNFFQFQPWRDGIAPIRHLNQDVLGVRL